MNSKLHDNLKPTRSGFTLIELLFVIAIIAVLGALTAGILGKAKKDAQIAATRSRITQIEAIMLTVMEDQEIRRLPGDVGDIVDARFPVNVEDNRRRRRFRIKQLNRRVRSALLLAEFPVAQFDANEFIANEELGQLAPAKAKPGPTQNTNFRDWASNIYGPDLINFLNTTETAETAFWRKIGEEIANDNIDEDSDEKEKPLNFKEPGEYLYLILSRVNIDGISALEALGPNVVGDPDEDGHPDIVDAFGDSMQLRIVQVAVEPGEALDAADIWTDVPDSEINWSQSTIDSNGVKIPNGYQFLEPVIPRSLNKIRFQIVSPNLEEIE